MTTRELLGHDVWALMKNYWLSEERWSAWALLTANLALTLGAVYINVLLNTANGTFYTPLQKLNPDGFYRAFVTVLLLIVLYLAVVLPRSFLNQTLQLRWRRWLTDQYLTHWLAERIFYRLRFSGKTDNPDQRISEDVRIFTELTVSLAFGLLSSLVTLASFAAILWRLSGSITVPISGFEITIPGYMFWVAVLYSGGGSVLAHLVGRPLIRLSNRQQSVEADFRFSLVRLREEAESIALYGGEAQERGIALSRFGSLYDNFKRLILRNIQYQTYQLFFGQFAALFPVLVASPRYFEGAIQFGILMQISNAFWQVNEALSWFIGNYTTFASWRAAVDRLTEFGGEIKREASVEVVGARIEKTPRDTIELEEVSVALPTGTPLLAPVSLSLKPQEAVLLKGPSGCGKSTLFRVLAGLWPYAAGRILLPAGVSTLFLPQRPYMPIGTLREALWFPARPAQDGDAVVHAALAAVDLSALGERLDEEAHWTHLLSPGEQQRVAIARALLNKPDWLFLDEATSALEEDQEGTLYRRLADALRRTTVISIGHRRSLEAYHQRLIMVEKESGHPGLIRVESPIDPSRRPK
jgi:vitamin B12/bleomycin/antimicrobial peptide transport system ATP-binding/permease protein